MFQVFVLLMGLFPAAATGGPSKDLEDALSLVSRSKFEDARPMLVSLLYAADLKKGDMVVARTALSKCYFYTGQVELARKEVLALLKKQPKLKLDVKRTSPDFLAFFDEVRDSVKARAKGEEPKRVDPIGKPVAEKPAEKTIEKTVEKVVEKVVEKPVVVVVNQDRPQPTSQPAPAGVSTSVSTVPTPAAVSVQPTVVAAPDESLTPRVVTTAPSVEYQPGPLWARWMPMGIGQFSNKDYVGGAVFLSLTVALAAANVVLAILTETRVNRATNQYSPDTPFGFYVAQQATAAAAYAALIAGTVDALAFSPARGRAAYNATTH